MNFLKLSLKSFEMCDFFMNNVKKNYKKDFKSVKKKKKETQNSDLLNKIVFTTDETNGYNR